MFLWAAGILISNHESGISHGKPELSLFWCKHENAVGILFVQHFGWEQWLLYFMTQWNLSSCQEQGGITIAYKCSSHVWPQIVITGEKWTSNDKQSHILYVYLNLFMFSLTVMMMMIMIMINYDGLLLSWLISLHRHHYSIIPRLRGSHFSPRTPAGLRGSSAPAPWRRGDSVVFTHPKKGSTANLSYMVHLG